MVTARTLLLVAVVLVSRGIVAQRTETRFLNRSVILDGAKDDRKSESNYSLIESARSSLGLDAETRKLPAAEPKESYCS
jgi:hypothetical protein